MHLAHSVNIGNAFSHLLPTLQHVVVGVVSDGEQMRWHLVPPLAPVFGDNILGVDWQTAVGVNGDAEEARVGLLEETKPTKFIARKYCQQN